jgi:hypothetical protein
MAEQRLTGYSWRRIGKPVVTLEGDGTLSQEEWESVALGPKIADDIGIRLLGERNAD